MPFPPHVPPFVIATQYSSLKLPKCAAQHISALAYVVDCPGPKIPPHAPPSDVAQSCAHMWGFALHAG